MLTCKLRNRQPGNVLVMVAISMVALLAMAALAVDIGRLYLARQFLVNSCDASGFAGVMELPDATAATARASAVAVSNRMATFQITFPESGMSEVGPKKIRVDGQLQVDYGFAGVLGPPSRTVSAHCVLQLMGSVGWVEGQVVPWGIPYYKADGTPYSYDNGVLYTLKMGSQMDIADGTVAKTGGNFYPLAISGAGANLYNYDIKWGYDGRISVDDVFLSEPGNKVGPTAQAVATDLDSLLKRASVPPWTDDTFNNYDYGNPRVAIVPIISPMGNGRDEIRVLGFGAFWINSVKGQVVDGYFISYSIPNAGGEGPDYGLRTFRLTE